MYSPILATLGFVLSKDKKSVLLVHRNKRHGDLHLGKYNGLGGKMEVGEDVFACLKREIMEEAGIVCEEAELRGTISWPGFGHGGEHWFGLFFWLLAFTANRGRSMRKEISIGNHLRNLKPYRCGKEISIFFPLFLMGIVNPSMGICPMLMDTL